MREIKFRVMHFFTGKWLYYNVLDFEGADNSGGLGWAINTIGEYTGIKDQRGTEIYEGDIIRGKIGKPHKVIYHAGRFMHSTHSKRGERKPLFPGVVYHRQFEVIGNIYLNPELLKESNDNLPKKK